MFKRQAVIVTWGVFTMNIPLTIGGFGMSLAVAIITGLALVLILVHWVDRPKGGGKHED
jgi:uncharacterized membrane protein